MNKQLIRNQIEQYIKDAIKECYKINVDNVKLEHPNNPSWGDYATNISLQIAKTVKQPPIEIAKKISYELILNNYKFEHSGKKYQIFDEVYFVSPGFINFRLSSQWLYYVLFSCSTLEGDYGSLDVGSKKKIIVEYSQPNSNKPMHVGHARNNFLGSAVANLLDFIGYETVKSNYVGDIGVHICKSMLMYKIYGNNSSPSKKPDHFVGDYYIMFENEVQKNPELEQEAKDLLIKWESGDKETLDLWKKLNKWVYKGWKETYKEQNVQFDIWEFESESIDVGKEMAELAVKKGLAIKDESGAIIAKLEKYGLPDKVLLRSDGTSVYSTKDLQLAFDSYKKYNFEKRLYVVDYRQSDYFNQIFKILELLGFEWAKNLVHIPYGMVKLPQGNMSSRKGIVVNADEVMQEIIEKEKIEIKNTNRELENNEKVIKDVSLAAFRYGLLKIDSSQNMVFDYDNVTKFEGNTGPYLQYTHARANSVLTKAEYRFEPNLHTYIMDKFNKQDFDDKEEHIMKLIYQFPEIVEDSALTYSPHILCNYLFELAQAFNSFYATNTILVKNENIQQYRLLLTHCTKQILNNGLKLLGIEPVEKM